MSEPQTVRWPWAVWAFMLGLVAAALALSLANDTFDTFVAIAVPMMIGYGTIGAFVASRVRGNPIGWLMLTVGLSFGVVAPLRGSDNRSFDYQIGLRANYFFGPTSRSRNEATSLSSF